MTPEQAAIEMAALDDITQRAQAHWTARMQGKRPLTLTADDKRILKTLAPDDLRTLETRLAAYTPVHADVDIRHEAALVAVAEVLRCMPQIAEAVRRGYAAEEVTA